VSITDRLVAVRRHFGFSQRAIASAAGVSANTWNGYETKNEPPNSGVLLRLTELGIDAHWLLTGEGAMLRAGDEKPAGGFGELAPLPLEGRRIDEAGFVLVPRYDVKASAGGGTLYEEQNLLGSIAFRREWLHKALHVNPADLLVVEASGDSMPGIADDGALLLLDRSEPAFRGDGAYVFVVDGLLLVKNLRLLLDGSLEVTSTDEHQSTRDVIARKDLDKVRIIGRVIWRAGRA